MQNYLLEDAQRIRDAVPEGTKIPGGSEHLFVLYAVLLRAKGLDVTASDIHDAWSAWMSETDVAHSSILPYSNLDEETKEEDRPFLKAVLNVAAMHELDAR